MLENFVHIIIPAILHNRTDYYIKGGRAYDIYFKNKTNSIDWDLVGTQKFINYIHDTLTNFSKKNNVSLLERDSYFDNNHLYQYGFEHYEMEKDDPYIIDIFVNDKISFITINNLNYIKMFNFVADLLITYDDRIRKIEKYKKSLGSEGYLNKTVTKFNEKYNVNFDISNSFDENKPLIIEFLTQYINFKFTDTTLKRIVQKRIVYPLSTLDDPDLGDIISILNTDFKDLLDRNLYKKNKKSINDFEFFLTEEFSDILSGIFIIQINLRENNRMLNKLRKTYKRFDNVIDISWENLSIDYKIWLVINCRNGEINLFNVDSTCNAYLDCINLRVKKNVDNCFPKNKIKYTEILLKEK